MTPTIIITKPGTSELQFTRMAGRRAQWRPALGIIIGAVVILVVLFFAK